MTAIAKQLGEMVGTLLANIISITGIDVTSLLSSL